MITEGLADRFCLEVLDAAFLLPPWDDAFPPDRTAIFFDLARPEFDNREYDRDRWFFGVNASIPRWMGYTLGFRLVENYQAKHPGVTAAQLVSKPALAFRPDSGAAE